MLRSFLAFLCLAFPLVAQTPPDDRSPLNRELPEWLDLRFESRWRYEGRQGNAFEIEDAENALLTRYRAGIGIRPNRYFQVYVEGIDARMLGVPRERVTTRYRNVFDLHQAYLVVGDASEGLWDLKAGRQSMSFGAERVIAPANWSNSRRAFDTVKLALHRGEDRVDIFTGSVVNEFTDRPDRSDYGNGFHGAYGSFRSWGSSLVVEPFFLYRTRRRVTGELGSVGDADTYAPGIRLERTAGEGWDFEVEMIRQFGSSGGDDIRAWAGAWILGYTFEDADWQPRLFAQLNFASGDEDPNDGRAGTYDQFFPANHRNRGAADLIGFRNMRNPQFGIHLRPNGKMLLAAEGLLLWLASSRDAYYTFGGAVRVPAVPGGASSTHVGNELDVSFSYSLSDYVSLGAGVGRFWRGQFLERYSDLRSSTFPYFFVELGQ